MLNNIPCQNTQCLKGSKMLINMKMMSKGQSSRYISIPLMAKME